jgi:hypothetical protein
VATSQPRGRAGGRQQTDTRLDAAGPLPDTYTNEKTPEKPGFSTSNCFKDPTRYWKFSLPDVEERRYWSAYRKAYEAALTRCSTKWAPWHIVPANKKWYRNLVVAQTIVETLREFDMRYPEPTIDPSKIVIE